MKDGITARVGRFFLGCDTLYICDDDALNLLGALHYSAVRRQDGWELSMSSADRAQAQLLLSESGADYSVLRRSGLPALCSRFSHRPGIPTGAVLACLPPCSRALYGRSMSRRATVRRGMRSLSSRCSTAFERSDVPRVRLYRRSICSRSALRILPKIRWSAG